LALPPIVLCKNHSLGEAWATGQFAPVISVAGLPSLRSVSNRSHEVLTSSADGVATAGIKIR
jgi:hypothetical protein